MFQVVQQLFGGGFFLVANEVVKMVVNGNHAVLFTHSCKLHFRFVKSQSHFLDRSLVAEQFKVLNAIFRVVLNAFHIFPDSDVAVAHADGDKFLLRVKDHGEGVVEMWVGDFEVGFEHVGVVGLVVVSLAAHHERGFDLFVSEFVVFDLQVVDFAVLSDDDELEGVLG